MTKKTCRNLLAASYMGLTLAYANPFTLVAQERQAVFEMDMEPVAGMLTESVANRQYPISGVHRGEAVRGFAGTGEAMRFDGYSTYVTGQVGDILSANRRKATFRVRVAPETYPLIAMRESTGERIPLFGVFNDGNDIALWLGQNGEYSFMCSVAGEKVEAQFTAPLPCNMWSEITGTIDGNAGMVRLYVNGLLVSEKSCAKGNINFTGGTMYVGRGVEEKKDGVFGLNFFNGIIDDILVYNDVVTPEAVQPNPLTIAVPPSRFAGDILRPAFHAMPSANWTNEPHGLFYANGKYHIFHQRNANGTYMGRMHWGHLVSDNLYDWTEAPVALFPGADGPDLWGCWSGCVVNDPQWNGGVPQIFYTAVDYTHASIARADVADASDPFLMRWNKRGTVIDHTPAGFSDFRDPYVFSADGRWYMVVGCGRNGKGCLVLSRYENGAWTNDGTVFFSDDNAPLGEFWEMPTVCLIDGKWLLTVSTINNGNNNTYYWVGNIRADGTFEAMTQARKVELDCFAVNGYGLMSPSVMQKDGRTVVIGIVPDKLPSARDVEKGWSHTFSLPRQWNISSDNYLLQAPFEGLTSMRGENRAATPSGAQLLNVDGRRFEASATFTAPASGRFGYRIFKVGSKSVGVYFDMASQKFFVDASNCDRLLTDGWESVCPGGVFSSALPKGIQPGDAVKVHLFVDNSIIDVFVNDMWASSVRVFSTDSNACGAEVFADNGADVSNVEAYNLNVAGYIAGVSIPQDGFSGADPVDPSPDLLLDPTGRYEVDENGRDVKLQKLTGLGLGMLLRSDAGALNDYERAAFDYFTAECPDGQIFTDATSSAILSAKGLNVLWVHVDADGDSRLPFSDATLQNLATFVRKGGNIYATGFATQLVEAIGRTSGFTPNEISLGEGNNPDIWTINATVDDHSTHYLTSNLDKLSGKDIPNYPVIGGLTQGEQTHRIDHNCIWFLERMYDGRNWSDPASRYTFEEQTRSRVLATWGRDAYNYGNAGIVEFYPVDEWKGTVVANGIAGANQFVHRNGANQWDYNQKRIINNVLVALNGSGSASALDEVLGDEGGLLLSVLNDAIVYTGAEPGTMVTLSDVQGRLLGMVAISDSGSIAVESRGIILAAVKSPSGLCRTFKLLLK